LLEEAGDNLQPEKVELAAKPAVELARRIEQALANIPADEEAWKRVQSGIQQQFSELNNQLGMRGYHHKPRLSKKASLRSPANSTAEPHRDRFAQVLSDEMQSRDQMLNAREREVIENHLIVKSLTELQGLIVPAEDWCAHCQ